MAFPDLVDIRTRVRTLLNETTAGLWTDAMLNRCISDIQRDIAFKGYCIQNVDTLTTTVSNRFVPFIGYMVKAIEYVPTVGNSRGLLRITPNMVGHVALSGTAPQYWYQWGKQIGIEPVPDAQYTLTATIIDFPTTELTNDTDEPEIPIEYHNLLVVGAAYKALLRSFKYASAGLLYKEYIGMLNIIKLYYTDTIPNGYSDFNVPVQTIQRGL